MQLFEWTNHWRTIWTDGREVPEEVVTGPFWYGYAVGHWEGGTLVVQTVDLDGRAWIDGNGTPLSEYGGKVEERWKRTGDKLELTITVNDPEYYTQPWSSEVKTFELQGRDSKYSELGEVIFAPMDELEFNRTIVNRRGGGTHPRQRPSIDDRSYCAAPRACFACAAPIRGSIICCRFIA